MKKKIIIALTALAIILLLIPQSIQNPVEGADDNSYHHQSFWWNWGGRPHIGIDIFAKKGTPIHPACAGIVIQTERDTPIGGNTVSILGTHGRIYYYAHMDEIKTHLGAIVTQKSTIGTVGKTGNAATTPPHLHFSIFTAIPRLDHWVPSDERVYKEDIYKPFLVDPAKALHGQQIF